MAYGTSISEDSIDNVDDMMIMNRDKSCLFVCFNDVVVATGNQKLMPLPATTGRSGATSRNAWKQYHECHRQGLRAKDWAAGYAYMHIWDKVST